MAWTLIPAYFFGGAFLANFVPHFVAGVTGRRFPTPFARPPFQGLSPPTTNVAYALINLALSYTLLFVVAGFELSRASQAAFVAAGFAFSGLGVAWRVGKLLPS